MKVGLPFIAVDELDQVLLIDSTASLVAAAPLTLTGVTHGTGTVTHGRADPGLVVGLATASTGDASISPLTGTVAQY